MGNSHLTMAEKVTHAVRDFQRQRTGHAPESVTVVLSEGTLVVTLHGALKIKLDDVAAIRTCQP